GSERSPTMLAIQRVARQAEEAFAAWMTEQTSLPEFWTNTPSGEGLTLSQRRTTGLPAPCGQPERHPGEDDLQHRQVGLRRKRVENARDDVFLLIRGGSRIPGQHLVPDEDRQDCESEDSRRTAAEPHDRRGPLPQCPSDEGKEGKHPEAVERYQRLHLHH